MTNETRAMLEDHVTGLIDRLEGLFGMIDSGDVSDEFVEEYGECADPHDVLMESPLEIVWEVGEPLQVTFCTGGPHIDVESSRAHGTFVGGYWGGEVVKRHHAIAERVIDYFCPEV